MQTTFMNGEICIPTEEYTSKDNTTQVVNAIYYFLSKLRHAVDASISKDAYYIYTAKYVISNTEEFKESENRVCLKGYEDFHKIMKFTSDHVVLKWLYIVWRELMLPAKDSYLEFSNILNVTAQKFGKYNGLFIQ